MILVSGNDLITYGINFFKPTIIKQTSLLYNSPSLLRSTKSQKSTLHIFVSTFRQTDTHHWKFYPDSFRVCAHLTASIAPLLILCNNGNDGNRKCSGSIHFCFCNSSNIGEMFSIWDSRYTVKIQQAMVNKWLN